jgi:inhibitor of KinA sporulation pathway (predicted exonuclease)
MGYMFKKELHTQDSDEASDFMCKLSEVIVSYLEGHEGEEANEFNTDGMLNVAMILQDCFKSDQWSFKIREYVKAFIPRYKKWIAGKMKMKWDNEKNKQQHLKAFNKILENLKQISAE